MGQPKLTSTHFTLIGIAIGIVIVLITAFILKDTIKPQDVDTSKYEIETKSPTDKKDVGEPSNCPVCEKPVNPSGDYYEIIANKKFIFCSDICHRSFLIEPTKYLENMKIKIDIQLLPGEKETPGPAQTPTSEPAQSPGTQYQQEPTTEHSQPLPIPPVDELPIPQTEPTATQNKDIIEEVPLNNTDTGTPNKPVEIPMPEEIPLDGSSEPSKSPTAKPQELQIEEIPLH